MAKLYAVTGTYHGAFIAAESEGGARRVFHQMYNGESILDAEECDWAYAGDYFIDF